MCEFRVRDFNVFEANRRLSLHELVQAVGQVQLLIADRLALLRVNLAEVLNHVQIVARCNVVGATVALGDAATAGGKSTKKKERKQQKQARNQTWPPT